MWVEERKHGRMRHQRRNSKNLFLLLFSTFFPSSSTFTLWRYSFRTRRHKVSSLPSTSKVNEISSSNQAVVSARSVAVEAIRLSSSNNNGFAIDKLESLESFRLHLSSRDRSFARLLVTTCVRRMGQIDRVLEMCQDDKTKRNKPRRRLNQVDRFVHAVLRVGAVQLLFEDVPHHAAVKETVDVLRTVPNNKLYIPEAKVKFVNAVLRRIGREGPTLLAKTNVLENASSWLIDELKKTYGTEATKNIIQSAMKESPRCLTIRHDPQSTDADKEATLKSIASQFDETLALPQGSLMVLSAPSGKVSDWPLYEEGAWWLQDVSATLPAIALDHALRHQGDTLGQKVVDLCAAPGGKTAQLCSFGYNVTAVEVSKRRSQRLRENMNRLGLDCNIFIANGSEWIPESTFAGVLVDAPCTATGTGSKRPDVLRKKLDCNELLNTQYDLLCHAAETLLAPGGILVYATCSLLPQECEDQITSFLKHSKDASTQMHTLPFQPGELPGFDDCIDQNGWLRVVPGSRPRSLNHVDGFFVARLQKDA